MTDHLTPPAQYRLDTTSSNALAIVGLIGGIILLAIVLAGVFVLAWHKSITGADALGIVSVIVGIAGGAFGVHLGVKAAQNNPTT